MRLHLDLKNILIIEHYNKNKMFQVTLPNPPIGIENTLGVVFFPLFRWLTFWKVNTPQCGVYTMSVRSMCYFCNCTADFPNLAYNLTKNFMACNGLLYKIIGIRVYNSCYGMLWLLFFHIYCKNHTTTVTNHPQTLPFFSGISRYLCNFSSNNRNFFDTTAWRCGR